MRFILFTISLLFCYGSHSAPNPETVVPQPSLKNAINWEKFLGRNDMTWTSMPKGWQEAPFLGNGELGLLVYALNKNEIKFELGNGKANDQRDIPDKMKSTENMMLYRGRLMVGSFNLKTQGDITGCDWRLDMAKAELRGNIITNKGTIAIRAYVHASAPLFVLEATPQGGEAVEKFQWNSEPGAATRLLLQKKSLLGSSEFPQIPTPKLGKSSNGIEFWEQKINPDYCLTTAWFQAPYQKGVRLLASSSYGKSPSAITQASCTIVKKAMQQKPAQLDNTHYAWWKNYYPASFISIPDPYWESFYWTQIYKLGAATRADGMVIDTCGPWLQYTNWGGVWWNLNVQLSYWPCYTGNRMNIADSLRLGITKNRQNLINTVPKKYRHDSAAVGRNTGQNFEGRVGYPGTSDSELHAEIGNLLWACHNLWWQYSVTQDQNILKNDVFPILRRSVNYYLHFLDKKDDGKWHLPKTHSPEYADTEDCNYDLALIKWGCQALIESCKTLNIKDPLLPKWKDVNENLTPFPSNEKEGYLIGKGKSLSSSHRHFSHLLMVFPLHLVDLKDPVERERILKTLNHWHSFTGALQGYSFTGGSLMASALGDGDRAYSILEGLKAYASCTTMYKEGGGPVIETPLSAAQSIHEMLFQSHGGVIAPFPAMPTQWDHASFGNLRAEGAFLVSGSWKDHQTAWVRITSLAGKPCIVKLKDPTEIKSDSVKITVLADGNISIPLLQGQSVLLYRGAKPDDSNIKAAVWPSSPNPLGKK